ncbi:hypothetical protein FJV80_20365 [Mesorhizobium sp. WSM4310]|uniref:hypothetical protein n=1 Tax=Mesorhizobium sp. WSM4310 TaxID=2589883 RepID=UPI00115EE70A|nr:hypothetical protein [Mesorhizobium sp. WSM4310]TRC82678.1 hypothetical protein FJV80_20365 [Mesorhizobium sp. WSM4310]
MPVAGFWNYFTEGPSAATCRPAALAGRLDEARGFAAAIRRTLPDHRADDFIGTFRFDADAEALSRQGARRIGLS